MAKMRKLSNGIIFLLSLLVLSCDPIIYFRVNGLKTYTDRFDCGKFEVVARDLNIVPEYSLLLQLTTMDTLSLDLRHFSIENSNGGYVAFQFASSKDSLDLVKGALSKFVGKKELYISIKKSAVTTGDTLILTYSEPIRCNGNDFFLDELIITLNPEFSKKD